MDEKQSFSLKEAKEFGKWLKSGRTKTKPQTPLRVVSKATGYAISYISMLERAVPHTETGSYVRPSEDFIHRAADFLRLPEEEGRLLAGYRATTGAITLAQVRQMLAENPGQGVLYVPGVEQPLLVDMENFMSRIENAVQKAITEQQERLLVKK